MSSKDLNCCSNEQIIRNDSKQMIIRWRYVRRIWRVRSDFPIHVLHIYFLQVLLHVYEHCHDAWTNSDRFFSMLGSVSSIAIHSFLIPPNILALMDLVYLAVPMLFLVWNFHNKPIFHRQSQFDAKMTPFRIVQAVIHKSFFAFRVVSRLIHVVSNFPIFEPFQDYVWVW